MKRIAAISFIDDETISVTMNTNGSNESFILSKIEGDKASVSVMNEIEKITKILNPSVLKKLDKSKSIRELKVNALKLKIDLERKEGMKVKLKEIKKKAKKTVKK